ncbi:uncharacterized protein LOC133654342 isoform X2 [Entelurus aequoreus]|uniref:uncharacterized protein LOC133654342 isoform X2 n=1 Tax=Entelurus aequoreus TaxID=161455 RepID=UPI002B1DB5DB|nr:uncharacterized protein LOC133654342 isoform X2 [Entelurus aequoreus]
MATPDVQTVEPPKKQFAWCCFRARHPTLSGRQGSTMATTQADVELQTFQIMEHMFADVCDYQVDCGGSNLQVDGLDFDPVSIGDQLKRIGDSLNEDATFCAALAGMERSLAQEAMEVAFSRGVDTLLQTQVQNEAVAPEMQMIKVCVAFGLFVKKSFPEQKNQVQRAVTAFFNSRLNPWISERGGWENVRQEMEGI